jgi:uncharacterized protein YabN with tetrapyrrole methylase and pyrophosphatase domain
MENLILNDSLDIRELNLEEMDEYWEKAKNLIRQK